MGDRTHCEFQVPIGVKPLIKALEDYLDFDEISYEDELITLVVYEANHGEYDDFTNLCTALSIPYNHYWGDGGEYDSGWKLVRFEGGERSETEGQDRMEGMVSASTVLKLLDESLEQAVAFLEKELDRGNCIDIKSAIVSQSPRCMLCSALLAKNDYWVNALLEVNQPLENFYSESHDAYLLDVALGVEHEGIISKLEQLDINKKISNTVRQCNEDGYGL